MSKQGHNDTKAEGTVKLEPFPGEEPYTHKGKAWVESSQAVFASHNLLVVANGGLHPEAAKIIDIPEDAYPRVDPTHPDHFRILDAKLKCKIQNMSNSRKRFSIQMRSWTEIYSAISLTTSLTTQHGYLCPRS